MRIEVMVIAYAPAGGREHPFVRVLSPYSDQFIASARGLGGAWNGGAWVFQTAQLADIETAVQDAYGVTGHPTEDDITELYARLDEVSHRVADAAGRFLPEPIPTAHQDQDRDYTAKGRLHLASRDLFAQNQGYSKYGAHTKAGRTRPEGLAELAIAATDLSEATSLRDFRRKIESGSEAHEMDGWSRLYQTARAVDRAEETLAALAPVPAEPDEPTARQAIAALAAMVADGIDAYQIPDIHHETRAGRYVYDEPDEMAAQRYISPAAIRMALAPIVRELRALAAGQSEDVTYQTYMALHCSNLPTRDGWVIRTTPLGGSLRAAGWRLAEAVRAVPQDEQAALGEARRGTAELAAMVERGFAELNVMVEDVRSLLEDEHEDAVLYVVLQWSDARARSLSVRPASVVREASAVISRADLIARIGENPDSDAIAGYLPEIQEAADSAAARAETALREEQTANAAQFDADQAAGVYEDYA